MTHVSLIEAVEAELVKPVYEGCDYRSGLRKALSIIRQHESAGVDLDEVEREFMKAYRGETKGTLLPSIRRRIRLGLNQIVPYLRTPEQPQEGNHAHVKETRVENGETGTRAAQPDKAEQFQSRVDLWMDACFGPEISTDKVERNHRFLEEALELVQACGCSREECSQLVDYVYGRPLGEPRQEVGGVMVTMAALCLANALDMHEAAETELARVWTKIDVIRAKQAAKPRGSALPVSPSYATPPKAGDARQQMNDAIREGKLDALDILPPQSLDCPMPPVVPPKAVRPDTADMVERATKAIFEIIQGYSTWKHARLYAEAALSALPPHRVDLEAGARAIYANNPATSNGKPMNREDCASVFPERISECTEDATGCASAWGLTTKDGE